MTYREKQAGGSVRVTGAMTKPLDVYPVGSVYLSMVSTDPGTLFGGTWVRFAQGRMLIGVNESDTDFDASGEIGGAKTHTLTEAEMPSHNHDMQHTHDVSRRSAVGGASGAARGGGTADANMTSEASSTPNTGSKGGGQPHNNMPPYYSVYMFRRTA